MNRTKIRTTITTQAVTGTGNGSIAISAFPTGDKGSGSEEMCRHWSGVLNEDQGRIDAAEENNDLQQYKDAVATQEEHIDLALDAGCVVIH